MNDVERQLHNSAFTLKLSVENRAVENTHWESDDYVTLSAANASIAVFTEAMQEFVDRCDNGEIRSTRTYNHFKALLKKI